MSCRHESYECYRVTYPWRYAVTRQDEGPDGHAVIRFIRWSDDDDPEFPCLCNCPECAAWRQLRAEIDGPAILPSE